MQRKSGRIVRAAVVAVLGVLPLAVGCESLPKGEPFAAAEPSQALSRIYLYRAIDPKEPREIEVSVGSAELGTLRPGEYLTVSVSPGEHIVRVHEPKLGSAVRSVDLLPGEAGWLEVGLREFSNALWIFRPEVPVARERITTTRLAADRVEAVPQPLPPAKSVDELMREARD